MDWRVSFIPSDLSDLTAAERDKRVNPKIVINIHTTSQLKGIVIPAVLENIAFRGHMRVKIHFINKFPYARLFEASFLEKPLFDYELAPLGSNLLGFDINYASIATIEWYHKKYFDIFSIFVLRFQDYKTLSVIKCMLSWAL